MKYPSECVLIQLKELVQKLNNMNTVAKFVPPELQEQLKDPNLFVPPIPDDVMSCLMTLLWLKINQEIDFNQQYISPNPPFPTPRIRSSAA